MSLVCGSAAARGRRGLPGSVPRATGAPACPGGCLPAGRGGCRRGDLRYGSGEAECCQRGRAAGRWRAGGCLARPAQPGDDLLGVSDGRPVADDAVRGGAGGTVQQ